MKILTLANATAEELEGVYFKGKVTTFDTLKAKGLTPLDWIATQNPPLKTAITVKNGFIDFRKYENVIVDTDFISFDEKMREFLPTELVFTVDSHDWIGIVAKLHEVKDNYAYYTLYKGSSSKIFHVHIPRMEVNLGTVYFLNRSDLADAVLAKHTSDIEFIKEHRAELIKN